MGHSVAQMSHIHLGSEMTEITEAYGFRGRTMIDRDGDKIGKIDDVYEAEQGGQAEWALVNTGLFGTKKTFVPLHNAQPVGEDIRVPLEKGRVKDAPSIEPDGELSESEERQLFEHYGVAYASDGDVSGPTTDDAMIRSEEEHGVVLHEERTVVDKGVVPKGRVRLSTDEQAEQETISETLRKERIKTDGDARS
jgi:hypothetical protein